MDKLKPGDKGWVPTSPYGTCPCCGSILMWAHDYSEAHLDTEIRFTGTFTPVDVRYIRHIEETLANASLFGTDAEKRMVQHMLGLVRYTWQTWLPDKDIPEWLMPVSEQLSEPPRRVKLPDVKYPNQH